MRASMKKRMAQQGFTLVEMAIVLIIIGLIIGAVLKGQDLIVNARGKRFANHIRQAEIAAWTHMDRMGYFPGDSVDKDGNMAENNSNFYGDINGLDANGTAASSTNATNAGIENFKGEVVFGSETYLVGIDMITVGSHTYPALCVARLDGRAFSEAGQVYARMLDASIDGVADSTAGKILGATTCSVDTTDGVADCTVGATSWADAALGGLCYFFDTGP